jgi:hypothetical protein
LEGQFSIVSTDQNGIFDYIGGIEFHVLTPNGYRIKKELKPEQDILNSCRQSKGFYMTGMRRK